MCCPACSYDIAPLGDKVKTTFYVLCVRGNTEYGKNQFEDNKDGTVTDKASGLMWSQVGPRCEDGLGLTVRQGPCICAERCLGTRTCAHGAGC